MQGTKVGCQTVNPENPDISVGNSFKNFAKYVCPLCGASGVILDSALLCSFLRGDT